MISEDTVLVDSQRARNAGMLATRRWRPAAGYGKILIYQQPLRCPRSRLCRAQARELSAGRKYAGRSSAAHWHKFSDATRVSNNDPNVARAKSLLLFTRCKNASRGAFQNAVQHMLRRAAAVISSSPISSPPWSRIAPAGWSVCP